MDKFFERRERAFQEFARPLLTTYNNEKNYFQMAVSRDQIEDNFYELYYLGVYKDYTKLYLMALDLYGDHDWRHIEFALFMYVREKTRLPLGYCITALHRFGNLYLTREFVDKLCDIPDFRFRLHDDEIWLKCDLEHYKYMKAHYQIEERDLIHNILQDMNLRSPVGKRIAERWMNMRYCILHGAGGTGKTHELIGMIEGLCEIISKWPVQIFVLAMTNLAVENVRERIERDEVEFGTMHSFARRKITRKRPVFLLIDEASMLNELLYKTLARLDEEEIVYRVLCVGDVQQLPPVNSTSIFKILLDKLPQLTIDLEVNYRCSDIILENAAQLWNIKPITYDHDIYIYEFFQCIRLVNGAFEHKQNINNISLDELVESMVITYHNEDVGAYNEYIAECVQSRPKGKILPGDKCMCTENYLDLKIYNNSLCRFVRDVDEKTVIVKYKEREIKVARESIILAYVITIHKSQGHQADKVIIILNGSIYDRRLINTAITRAKKKVTMVHSFNDDESEEDDG
jgi:hypothetical protein